jgi:molybdopterin-guanine dinucleotide biosynthesis adapter protein
MQRGGVPAVAVVGFKNSGKTTLVARLVEAFKREGLRVGTCKHDGAHDFEIDRPGTDSWQHRAAGADVTLVASRTHAALQQFYEGAAEPPLERWLEELSDPRLGLDLIVVEGWKNSSLPKIVLLRDLADAKNVEHLSNVVCFAADSPLPSIAVHDSPVYYDRDDIVTLVQLIRARVLRGGS